MLTTSIRAILSTCLFVLISGCATLPSETNNTGIVVIPIDQKPGRSSDFFGKYRLNYYKSLDQESRTGVVTLDPSKSFAVIKGLEPGNYWFKDLQFVYESSGKLGSYNSSSFTVTVSPGVISISPQMLRVTLRRKSGGGRTQGKSLERSNAILVDEIMSKFENDKNFAYWQF